ncbi:MAG TPA: hypothetical protein VLN59_03095, partial [Burkholderiales bacterium]|nr:hypothetical protein [Burkholderiales bacterium]
MKADPRKLAVAVAAASALMTLPAFAAGYSAESPSGTMGDNSTRSSGSAHEQKGKSSNTQQ